MKNWWMIGVVTTVLLAACNSSPEDESGGVIAGDPWVRTTVGAERTDMTALFVNLTNPTSHDITLTTASCEGVAAAVEVHEMVERDGAMVMRETKDGVVVPAESHLHLAPGGPHIMLMGLTAELAAGAVEISCTLTFDDGRDVDVVAPVKEFTEEQDTYHTHAPTTG